MSQQMVRHTYLMEVLNAAGMALALYFAVSAAIDGSVFFPCLQGWLFLINYKNFRRQAVLRRTLAELAEQERRLQELTGRQP